MRLQLLSLVTALGLWLAPGALSQSAVPPTPQGTNKPAASQSLPVNPPNTGNMATSANVPPPQQSGRPAPLGIFSANRSPWSVNNPVYPPTPNRQSTTRWGAQPQMTPNQMVNSMAFLSTLGSFMDRVDIACSMSKRAQQMYWMDIRDPLCECRMGPCDNEHMDPSPNARADCGNIGNCCCSYPPYENLLQATLFGGMSGGRPGGRPVGAPGGAPGTGAFQPNRPGIPGLLPSRNPRGQTSPTFTDFLNMWAL